MCVCVCVWHTFGILEPQHSNHGQDGLLSTRLFHGIFPLYKKLPSTHLHEARRCVPCRSHLHTGPRQKWKENGNQMVPGNSLHASIQSSFPAMDLAVQWFRIHLPMQGTLLPFLVREDLTCHGTAQRVRHLTGHGTSMPLNHKYWVHESTWSPEVTTRWATKIKSPWTATRESRYSKEDPAHPKLIM